MSMEFLRRDDEIGVFNSTENMVFSVVIIGKTLLCRWRDQPQILYSSSCRAQSGSFLRKRRAYSHRRPPLQIHGLPFSRQRARRSSRRGLKRENGFSPSAYSKPDLTIRLSPRLLPTTAVHLYEMLSSPTGSRIRAKDRPEKPLFKIPAHSLRRRGLRERRADTLVDACHWLLACGRRIHPRNLSSVARSPRIRIPAPHGRISGGPPGKTDRPLGA